LFFSFCYLADCLNQNILCFGIRFGIRLVGIMSLIAVQIFFL